MARDSLDDIYRRLIAVERKVAHSDNSPTIPIYDASGFPEDAIEGQIAIAPGSGGVGGGGMPLGLCTVEGSVNSASISRPKDLAFNSSGFWTNDTASFALTASTNGHVKFLQSGLYVIQASLRVNNFRSETSDLTIAEILNLNCTDAGSGSYYGIELSETQVGSVIGRGLLPGAGGPAPIMMLTSTFNLTDSYMVLQYSDANHVTWPVQLHFMLDWSVDLSHDINYSLSIVRYPEDASASTPPSSGGGSGIQFETYPQHGQWLYIQTDGSATSPSGFGIELFDESGNGIDLATSSGGGLTLSTSGGGLLYLRSTGGIKAEATSGNFQLLADSGRIILESTGILSLRSNNNITIQPDGIVQVKLQNFDTTVFQIVTTGGATLMEVRGDGTLHTLTGSTWVDDL